MCEDKKRCSCRSDLHDLPGKRTHLIFPRCLRLSSGIPAKSDSQTSSNMKFIVLMLHRKRPKEGHNLTLLVVIVQPDSLAPTNHLMVKSSQDSYTALDLHRSYARPSVLESAQDLELFFFLLPGDWYGKQWKLPSESTPGWKKSHPGSYHFIYIHVNNMYLYVYIYIYVDIDMYIYIYIDIDMCVYIYIHKYR